MISSVCQRWGLGRDAYRPAGEVVDTRSLEVAPITSDSEARAFVERHHYSKSYPAARYRFGLYAKRLAAPYAWSIGTRHERHLVGVAVFSHPSNTLALRPLPLEAQRPDREETPLTHDATWCPSVELGRFVLLDREVAPEVGANAETWFLARIFELLKREGLAGVVSFSDPYRRTTADGRDVFAGHVGTIYQAHNAVYLGQARTDTARFLPDGKTLHNRSVAKLRGCERGWRYVVEQLVAYGANAPSSSEDMAAWTERWVARLTRTVRKPGNHKYVWAFERALKRSLPQSLPYPKLLEAA